MVKCGSYGVSHVVIGIDFVISGPGRKIRGQPVICKNCIWTSIGRAIQATMVKFTELVENEMCKCDEKFQGRRSKLKVRAIELTFAQ